jgi:hypothetical protein
MKNSPPGKPEGEVKEDHNHDLDGEATPENEIDQLALYGAVRRWTAYRLSSFRDWDFDEIVNEAYLHAHSLVKSKYRNNLGSVNTFLRSRLYSPVAMRYQTANNIIVTRELLDGKLGPRQYEKRKHISIRPEIHMASIEKEPNPEPGWVDALESVIDEEEREICNLIMRGNKPIEIQEKLGISYYLYRKILLRIRVKLRPIIGES